MSEWLLGYVSDEMDVAIPDALVEIGPLTLRSGASGAVWGDVEAGAHEVVLAAPGFGSKRVQVTLAPEAPVRFRLLSAAPLGYAWPKCVRAGDAASLRVHATDAYRLELWRYGWEPELVADLGVFDLHPPDALRQVLPDGDVSRDGARWNAAGSEWAVDPRHVVTAPDRSGLYYFHMRGARHFSFPWVVAPRAPSAPLAVFASDITWNAYNDFGGRSNYVSHERLPDAPSVFTKQEGVWYADPELPGWWGTESEPLSFDRPEPHNAVGAEERITDPIERRGAEHVAPAEWRFLGWLEREGFAYDLYSETQFAAGEVDLDAYRVVVLSTHPEYWTRDMYERLKDWVIARGGRLAYLGGNGIDCEVTLLDDHRMQIHNGDMREVIENWARVDSRFGLRGESAAPLLGVALTFAGYETGAPYRVLDASHWAFVGTGLADGDVFGAESLDRRNPGGASGHETDKLSHNAPPQTRVLAKGLNPDEGGAEIVHIEFEGGGEVFSVGSISYTCSIAVDPHISAISANVLRRFLR